MTEKTITCIICPIGCSITVRGEGDQILHMEGNQCNRGVDYARNEFVCPLRILTTTVGVGGADSPLVSVRSDKPIPKDLLMQCMEEIQKVRLEAPVARYQVVIPHILGTDANIVATGEVR